MRKFDRFIGKIPFAGKMSIKPLIFGLYQSTNPSERKTSYLLFMGILLLLVLMHGVQAKMGIDSLGFVSPVWAKIVSLLYAVTNLGVLLTQIYLGYRSTRFLVRGKYPRTRRSCSEYSGVEMAIMLAITLGGQFIFLSQYILYY